MAKTTSTGNRFSFRIPKTVWRAIKVYCLHEDVLMKDFLPNVCRQFLEERENYVAYSGPKRRFDVELPYSYRAIPTKIDDEEVQQMTFAVSDNFADLLREQAEEHGVSVRDLVWTALYEFIVRDWNENR